MKSKIIKNRFICFILALIMIFTSVSSVFAFDYYATTQSTYRWNKVESEDELIEALRLNAGVRDSKYLNTDASSTAGAANILIVYSSVDGNDYFYTGGLNGSVADKDQFQLITTSGGVSGDGKCFIEGFSTSMTSFKTKTDLNTPMIKMINETHTHNGINNGATDYMIFKNEKALVNKYTLSGEAYFDRAAHGDKKYDKFKEKKKTEWAKYWVNYPDCRFEEVLMSSIKNNKINQDTSLTKQLSVNISFPVHTSEGGVVFYYEPTADIPFYQAYNVTNSKGKVERIDFATDSPGSTRWIQFWYVVDYVHKGVVSQASYDQFRIFYMTSFAMPRAKDSSGTSPLLSGMSSNNVMYGGTFAPSYGRGGFVLGSERKLGTFSEAEIKQSSFTLYVAQKVEAPNVSTDIDGLLNIYDGTLIDGSTHSITVGLGDTLVVEGECVLSGTLIIDGGTLIVKGRITTNDKSTPTIEIKNNGTVIVQKTGVILANGSESNIKIYMLSGGTMFNSGFVCANEFSLNRAMVYGTYGSRTVKNNASEYTSKLSDYDKYIDEGKSPKDIAPVDITSNVLWPSIVANSGGKFYKSTSK